MDLACLRSYGLTLFDKFFNAKSTKWLPIL